MIRRSRSRRLADIERVLQRMNATIEVVEELPEEPEEHPLAAVLGSLAVEFRTVYAGYLDGDETPSVLRMAEEIHLRALVPARNAQAARSFHSHVARGTWRQEWLKPTVPEGLTDAEVAILLDDDRAWPAWDTTMRNEYDRPKCSRCAYETVRVVRACAYCPRPQQGLDPWGRCKRCEWQWRPGLEACPLCGGGLVDHRDALAGRVPVAWDLPEWAPLDAAPPWRKRQWGELPAAPTAERPDQVRTAAGLPRATADPGAQRTHLPMTDRGGS